MGLFMASTQGLVDWVGEWEGFCCKAMGVTGVITTFSFTGCGLPVLTSTDTVPKLGVAGPDAGMGGASKTGTSGTAVGTGDPVETSALLAGLGVGKAWGNPASSGTGQTNAINTKKANIPPPAYHLNGQRLGENSMGPVQRLGLYGFAWIWLRPTLKSRGGDWGNKGSKARSSAFKWRQMPKARLRTKSPSGMSPN
jgi:hypothetical protein